MFKHDPKRFKRMAQLYISRIFFLRTSTSFFPTPTPCIYSCWHINFKLVKCTYFGIHQTFVNNQFILYVKTCLIILGQNQENTEGEIIDVNVSFQDQLGHFHHGAFVVSVAASHARSSTKSECPSLKTEPFAQTGDSGAVVIDKTSGIVIGLVVASYQHYVQPNDHVTFCLRMDYALRYFSEKYNLNLGRFRAFVE